MQVSIKYSWENIKEMDGKAEGGILQTMKNHLPYPFLSRGGADGA